MLRRENAGMSSEMEVGILQAEYLRFPESVSYTHLDVYKRQLWKHVKVQPRTFCRTVRRVADAGKVKDYRSGAEGKPSLKRAS